MSYTAVYAVDRARYMLSVCVNLHPIDIGFSSAAGIMLQYSYLKPRAYTLYYAARSELNKEGLLLKASMHPDRATWAEKAVGSADINITACCYNLS